MSDESSNQVEDDKKSSANAPSKRLNKGKKVVVFDDVDDYYESNSTTLSWSSNGVLEYEEKLKKVASKKLKILFKGKAVSAINQGEEVGFDHYHETSNTIVSSLSNGVVDRCPICRKAFSSKKAVHGHMRCHSDRSYRGMDPPERPSRPKPNPKPKPKPITTCADDEMEVAGCSGSAGGYGRSNLTCLPSWPSEAKRRRTSVGGGAGVAASNSSVNCAEKEEEEEELLVGAACTLTLLATGDERFPGSNKDGIRVSPPSNNKAEDVNINVGCSSSAAGKKRVRENDEKVFMEDPSTSNHGGKAAAAASRLHVCKECNKAFESGQALGGHMRYHYKPPAADAPISVALPLPLPVPVDQAPVADVVAEDQVPVAAILEDQAPVADDVAKDQAPRVRCFDLNEMASDYDC